MTNRDEPNSTRPLPPPRFSLRTLAFAITAICVLLALWREMQPLPWAMVVLTLLVIAAHVAGNALGTRLRDGLPKTSATHSPSPIAVRTEHFAPVSNLSGKQPLGWLMPIALGLGVAAGMIGGGVFMWRVYGAALDRLAIGITLLAFGVLGGISMFLLSSFVHYGFLALRQLHRHDEQSSDRGQLK